jgi:hypothetical protein
MKIKLPLIFLLIFSFVDAQVPSTWSSSSTYTSGALALDANGVTYIAQQDVSAGTALSDTTYWKSLDAAAPSSAPSTSAPTTTPDTSTVPSSTPDTNTTLTGGRLINLSTRGYVGTGIQRLIGGFRVYGGSLDVLVRGFGPSRANTDNLDDPTLTWKTNPASLLPSTSGIVSEVDDATGNSRLSGVSSDTQALLDVLVDKETADIQTVSNWDNNLSKGYTAFITTVTGTEEGIGRIGINDISDQTGAGQLVNISTRGYVGSSGTEYLIAGFQIRGGSVQVCIRAFGPSRSNDDALSDPQVELIQQVSDYHTTKTTLAWNDDYNVDYDDGTTQTANTASSIPTYLDTLIAKESAIVITLPNGNYTAKVSGVGGVTGIGRVGIDKVVE